MKKREAGRPEIVFEDDVLFVLNKPSGLVVNRVKTVKEKTLQDWVEENVKDGKWQGGGLSDFSRRSGIVHRLDKGTSGLILAAKTEAAFKNLQKQFKERRVEKKYLALIHGRLEPKKGEINLPILRSKKNRERFTVSPEGRKSRTKYKILKYCGVEALGDFSFLELELLTGRTHQIRVHFSFLGHPLVSDLKYGGRRFRKDSLWCPRIFLHSFHIGFKHPKTGHFCRFSSPLPCELQNVILYICAKNSSGPCFSSS